MSNPGSGQIDHVLQEDRLYPPSEEFARAAGIGSPEQYQDLYDNSPEFYVSLNAETAEIENCNQTLADALGYSKADLLGKPVDFVYADDCMDKVRSTFDQFRETGTVRNVELQLKRADGTTIDVVLNVSAVRDEEGNILRSRSVWRDITERNPQQTGRSQSETTERLISIFTQESHESRCRGHPLVGSLDRRIGRSTVCGRFPIGATWSHGDHGPTCDPELLEIRSRRSHHGHIHLALRHRPTNK